MAGTAGGYNIDNYLIPIDNTLRLYNVAGSNMNVLGVAPDAIGKIEVDGVTLTTNAQGAITLNLANANTWTATQTFSVNGTAAIFQITSPKGDIVQFYNNSGTVVGYINNVGNISFNFAFFNGSISTNGSLNVNATTTTLAGTTAGSIVYSMPFQGSSYKKFIAYANGYENDTTTAQSITFPVAFSSVAGITYNSTGLTLTNSLTALTISAPNSTTTYTGMIIVEGF